MQTISKITSRVFWNVSCSMCGQRSLEHRRCLRTPPAGVPLRCTAEAAKLPKCLTTVTTEWSAGSLCRLPRLEWTNSHCVALHAAWPASSRKWWHHAKLESRCQPAPWPYTTSNKLLNHNMHSLSYKFSPSLDACEPALLKCIVRPLPSPHNFHKRTSQCQRCWTHQLFWQHRDRDEGKQDRGHCLAVPNGMSTASRHSPSWTSNRGSVQESYPAALHTETAKGKSA